MGHGRRRLAVRAALLRHDAQRQREHLMARLAKSLPQELRYWVLVTAGVEHIEDHEEVPAVRFADVAHRMHDRIFPRRKRAPWIASWVDSRGRRRRDLVSFEDGGEERPSTPTTLPSPSEKMIESPAFQAVWERIKTWDIDAGDGPSGATGSHVAAILGALQDQHMMPAPGAVQAARDFAASLALCAREMPDTLADIEYEGQAARHPEYIDVAEHDAREDLAAERRASAAVPVLVKDAPVFVTAAFQRGTGLRYTVALIDGRRLRDHLDNAIRTRRVRRGHYSTTGRWYLTGYVAALQATRLAVFGDVL